MYEHRREKLLSRHRFTRRVLLHIAIAFLAILVALALGVMGYRYLGGLPWIDALLNAAMILGGMGPVDPLTRPAAKVFASVYALCSGLFFIGLLALLLVPFAHRLLHTLHLEESESDKN